MPLDGIRNLEWLAHNAARNYPLVITADGKSTDELFELPVSVLTGVYVYLPWDRDIDPSRFFVSRVMNLPDKLTIELGYQPLTGAAITIGSVSTARVTFSSTQVLRLSPANGWEDVVGTVLIDELPEGNKAPIGTFTFEYEQTQLEVDCIRPAARSLSGILVTDRAEQSILATGIVNIVAGENMRARVEVDGNEYTVYLDAVDGSEFGSDCACGVELGDPIYFLNNVRPNEQGNINLVGAKCLDITIAENSINLANPCSEPCCGCETAEQLTEAIAPLVDDLDRLKSAANRLGNEQLSLRGIIDSLSRFNPSDGVTPTTTTGPTTTTTSTSTSTSTSTTTSTTTTSTTTSTSTTSTTTSTTPSPTDDPAVLCTPVYSFEDGILVNCEEANITVATSTNWFQLSTRFIIDESEIDSPDYPDLVQIGTDEKPVGFESDVVSVIGGIGTEGYGICLGNTLPGFVEGGLGTEVFESLAIPTGVTVKLWHDHTKSLLIAELVGPLVYYSESAYPLLLVDGHIARAWTGLLPDGSPVNTMFPPSTRRNMATDMPNYFGAGFASAILNCVYFEVVASV